LCTGCAAGKLVYAEVSVSFDQIEELDDAVRADDFRREALPYEAVFLAGKALLAYRRRGGPQEAHMTEHAEAISKLCTRLAKPTIACTGSSTATTRTGRPGKS
jgi:hypothetical protein